MQIKRYVPEEVILADKQHAEMCQIQSIIEDVASSELADGENHGTQIGSTLRQTWEDDERACHEKAQWSFQEDQGQQDVHVLVQICYAWEFCLLVQCTCTSNKLLQNASL